jgi:hypothetical protein
MKSMDVTFLYNFAEHWSFDKAVRLPFFQTELKSHAW